MDDHSHTGLGPKVRTRKPALGWITGYCAAVLLALPLACTTLLGETPTPRPTYTPYPTYTPAAPVGAPTPIISPDRFREVGNKQWFFGETDAALERGEDAFDQGKYQEALEEFLEAQRLHEEPNPVLQNWIGSSYKALGQLDQAINHYTNTIELEDDAVNRTNRGLLYAETRQCSSAIEDAKAAFAMEPAGGEGFHTDVSANIILSACYMEQGDYLSALQHADAAYALSAEHDILAETVEEILQHRTTVQLILDGKAWPEDLFDEPTLTHFDAGLELLEAGKYEEAINRLEHAQEIHSQPSGAIQSRIGRAYSALGQHEKAIEHYNAAVGIRDEASHRVNRAAEYAENGRCAEATTDAEAALGMNPYFEPGHHTSAEAHRIIAECLTAQGKDEGAQAHLAQFNVIARAHGYPEEEMATATKAVPAAEETESIRAVDQNAKWLEHKYPETARRLAQLSWVKDGLNTAEEEEIMDDLLQILISQSRAGTLLLNPEANPTKPVDSILDMPFIQSISPGDAQAIKSLKKISQEDTTKLKTILGHPTFAGGITDEWTPIIAMLWGVQKYNPKLSSRLLNPGEASIESRTIELPLTGTTDLHVIRIGTTGNPETMDRIEEAVRNVEFFMHLPLPTRMVAVLFADSVTPSYGGNNFETSIAIKPKHEHDAENLPSILAHEVAHYYWAGYRDWINEGMANLIEAYHRWQTTGLPMTTSEYPCPEADNIQELEGVNPEKHQSAFRCNYTLGERLFLDLWNELGDVPFREGAQRLYERSEEGTGKAGIAEVREAFNNSPRVDSWYNNPSPKIVEITTETSPTWRLDEIHGTITEAGIVLRKDEPPVTSFSARSHTGPAYFYFQYKHPTFREESWTVNLLMTQAFEDGFAYDIRPLELNVKGANVGGTWQLSVGPSADKRWKTGKHRVALHDGNGNKVAEARWTVTP